MKTLQSICFALSLAGLVLSSIFSSLAIAAISLILAGSGALMEDYIVDNRRAGR